MNDCQSRSVPFVYCMVAVGHCLFCSFDLFGIDFINQLIYSSVIVYFSWVHCCYSVSLENPSGVNSICSLFLLLVLHCTFIVLYHTVSEVEKVVLHIKLHLSVLVVRHFPWFGYIFFLYLYCLYSIHTFSSEI